MVLGDVMEKRIVLILLPSIILMGCSGGLRTIHNTTNGSFCTAHGKSTIQATHESAQVFSHAKVDLEAFLEEETNGFRPQSIQTDNLQNIILPRDFNVVLTVDNSCLQERSRFGSSGSFALTHVLSKKRRISKMSRLASYNVRLPASFSMAELQEVADEDACVIGVSKSVTAQLLTSPVEIPNDPKYSKQTHLSAIDYGRTYNYFFGSSGITKDVVIAIIDNGVDYNHEDLKSNMWINQAEKNGATGVDDDNNGYIDDIYGYDFVTDVGDPKHKYSNFDDAGNGHGTHVAGLAAAVTNNNVGVAGVMAKHAKIMALNVFGNKETTDMTYVDNAIRYAADMGADVINLSLGGEGKSASTKAALQYAVSKSVTVLVAAGNDSKILTASTFYTPASYGKDINGVVTIGATDANPNSLGNLCSFSNKSINYVELGSPGCDTTPGRGSQGIASTFPGNKYAFMAGTSMASPVAAGAAAVVYGFVRDHYNKTLTPAEVESILKDGSRSIASLNNSIANGKNLDLGFIKEKIERDYYIEPPNPGTNPGTIPGTGCESQGE